MQKVIVNDVSVTSYKCEMLFEKTTLSCGTCFLVKQENISYLVTNWHNFSGRNPATQKPLSSNAAIPNKIRVLLPLKGRLGFSDLEEFPLIGEDENDLWIEHPRKNEVDVALLEIDIPAKFEPRYVSSIQADPYLDLVVAGDVFIVGYPLGITVAETLPLWKRASFASEPGIDVDQLPKYLVDTATREGMSGSPVFARSSYVKGGFDVTGDAHEDNRPWSVAYQYSFIGIYSGRLGQDTFQAQLGIVWKSSVIQEIINGSMPPNP